MVGSVVLAFVLHHEILAGLALTTAMLSTTYHYTGYITIEAMDTVFAAVYIVLGPYLLWQAHASQTEWLVAGLITASAFGIYLMSTWHRRRKLCNTYVDWHAFWHISASAMTLFVYMVYFHTVNF